MDSVWCYTGSVQQEGTHDKDMEVCFGWSADVCIWVVERADWYIDNYYAPIVH